MTNFLEAGFVGEGWQEGGGGNVKKDVTGLRQKRQCTNIKTSLNLAYKIVNYVFDSEISQTAGAKEYKPTQGWVGVGRNTLRQTASKKVFKTQSSSAVTTCTPM